MKITKKKVKKLLTGLKAIKAVLANSKKYMANEIITDEKAKEILKALDKYARGYDIREYGLPIGGGFYSPQYEDDMVKIIKSILSEVN